MLRCYSARIDTKKHNEIWCKCDIRDVVKKKCGAHLLTLYSSASEEIKRIHVNGFDLMRFEIGWVILNF